MREPPDGLALMPKNGRGQRMVFRPQEEYRCFTKAEMKEVGSIMIDYRWLHEYGADLETIIAKTEREIKRLNQIRQAFQDYNVTLEKHGEYMNAAYKNERRDRLNYAKKNKLKTTLLWTGNGVQLVAIITLSIITGLNQ